MRGGDGLLLHLNHLDVRLAQAQFVAADHHFNRIPQRRDLAHINIRPLRDAHVHDAAFDRAFACHFHDGDRLAYIHLFQSSHDVLVQKLILQGNLSPQAMRRPPSPLSLSMVERVFNSLI